MEETPEERTASILWKPDGRKNDASIYRKRNRNRRPPAEAAGHTWWIMSGGSCWSYLVDHVRRKLLVIPGGSRPAEAAGFGLVFFGWRAAFCAAFPAWCFRPGVSAGLFADRFQLADGWRTISRPFSESFELSDIFQNCSKSRHISPNRLKIGFSVKIDHFRFDMPNRGKKSQKNGPGIFTGSSGGKSWYNPIRVRESRSRAAIG